MKKLRVMVLMHQNLVPPDTLEGASRKEIDSWQTEYDVICALRGLGHEVLKLGLGDELLPIRKAIDEWKPDLAFNLMEGFHGECIYDQHVVSYLELMRMPYTGCCPRGLTLSRDKALCKKILSYHRLKTPEFVAVPMGRKLKRPRRLQFPLIVKSLTEEASTGISQASVVTDDEKLKERIAFIHEHIGTDAIVEEYIEGREIYVGLMGDKRLEVLPTWEILLDDLPPDAPRIATSRVKWDEKYQGKYNIKWAGAELSDDVAERVKRRSKRIYKALNLSGYARLDYRLTPDGECYLLEANPNPNIAIADEFASSAISTGVTYPQLIQRILGQALRRSD